MFVLSSKIEGIKKRGLPHTWRQAKHMARRSDHVERITGSRETEVVVSTFPFYHKIEKQSGQ